MIQKYLKSTTSMAFLTILAIISILAGLGFLINPETTPTIIIRLIGLLWILEGVAFLLGAWVNRLKDKLREKE